MVDWGQVLSVMITGLIVVFIALIVLIFIIWVMGKISVSIKKREKPNAIEKKESTQTADEQASLAAFPDNNLQTIAVISAAVSAFMENKPFVIKSIKHSRSSRPVWNMAGITDNTRPF